MSLGFTLLLVAITISPALTILDGSAAQSVVAVLAVAALGAVGLSARAADVNYSARVSGYLRIAAAVPVIWMVAQLLPTPIGAHTIWVNANEALDRRPWGHVSIDLGATIIALGFYLSNVGLVVTALFALRDRRRAEVFLLCLAAVTTLTTIVLLVGRTTNWAQANDVLGAAGSMGVIFALTLAALALERDQGRHAEHGRLIQKPHTIWIFCGLGLAVGIVGIGVGTTLNVMLTALFGVFTFGSIQAIRRAGLPNWAAGIVVVTMAIAAAMVIAWRYDSTRSLSPFLQFAASASPDVISMAQRILSDTSWRGTGAGSYALLVPIYQELGNSMTGAPSTAATIAIELGWPMALFAFAATLALVVILCRGALNRGRDSFYPAAAAAAAIVILGQAFCDASALNSGIAAIASTLTGLGLAQSASSGD